MGASQKHATAKRAGGDAAKPCYRAAIALNRTGSTTHMYPTYPNPQDARDHRNRLRRISPPWGSWAAVGFSYTGSCRLLLGAKALPCTHCLCWPSCYRPPVQGSPYVYSCYTCGSGNNTTASRAYSCIWKVRHLYSILLAYRSANFLPFLPLSTKLPRKSFNWLPYAWGQTTHEARLRKEAGDTSFLV